MFATLLLQLLREAIIDPGVDAVLVVGFDLLTCSESCHAVLEV